MKTQKTTTVISLVAALLLVASPFSSVSAEELESVNDHMLIAKHHEALLKEAEVKLEEHKTALEDYEDRSQYYGRRGQEFQSHTIANIREYEKVIADNKLKAELHYKLATSENQASHFVSSITTIQVN